MNNLLDNTNASSSMDSAASYKKFYSVLIQSKTIDSFQKKILEFVSDLGFSDYIFMRLDRHWHKHTNYGLLYSVPEELIRIYHDEKMYIDDLLIAFTMKNTTPCFTSFFYNYINNAPYEIQFIKKNRMIQQLNRRFSYFDHYAVPIAAYNERGKVLLIITNKNTHSDHFQSQIQPSKQTIQSLCQAIDAVSTKKFYTSFINYEDRPSKISPRQLAVLSKLANSDLSIIELAKEMNISPITAHQHIAASKRKLGVATNIAAIKKLILLECIHYS